MWHDDLIKSGNSFQYLTQTRRQTRQRPKRRFLDVVKEDMGEVGAKETNVEDGKVWRMMMRCGHP